MSVRTLSFATGLLTLMLSLKFDTALGESFYGPHMSPSLDGRPAPQPSTPPLWQFGFGAGGGVSPHYPASDQSSLRFLASPTFRYRGRVLRSDDEGTRARLLKFENSEVDLSGAASFPVSSSENEARLGMRQLDWIGEVGPRLNLRWRFQNRSKFKGDVLRLTLPFRTVASSDGSSLAHRGFIFQPGLSFTRILDAPTSLNSEISIELETRVAFVDSTLADYYFAVAPSEVTAKRPAFDGKAGVMSVGTGLTLFIAPKNTVINEGSSFFAGLWYANTGLSANRQSPLHKTDQQFLFFAGINILWINSDDTEGDL